MYVYLWNDFFKETQWIVDCSVKELQIRSQGSKTQCYRLLRNLLVLGSRNLSEQNVSLAH